MAVRIANGRTPRAEDDVTEYVISQWQHTTKVSPLYLGYRWLMAITALGACILCYITPYSGTDYIPPEDVKPVYSKWFIYATNLGFLHLVGQAVLALYLTQIAYNEQQTLLKAHENGCNGNVHENGVAPKGRKYRDVARLRRLCSIYHYLYSAAAAHAIEISIIYWGAVYEPETHVIDTVNNLTHTYNTAFMLLETFVVRINSDLSVIPKILLSGVIYGIITYPYWLLGGTDRFGNPNLYPFLDYNKPVSAIIFLAIISFGGALMVLVHLVLQAMRRFVHRKFVMTQI